MTPAALAGAIFYVLHHIVVITNLYLVSGVLLRLRRTTDVAGLGGRHRHQPPSSRPPMLPRPAVAPCVPARRCAAVVGLPRQARDPRRNVRRRCVLVGRARAGGG